MRIAFVGRARSGKTTCAAVFGRYLAARGLPVLAVDATVEAPGARRLAATLGLAEPASATAWLDGQLGGARRALSFDPDGLSICPSAVSPEGVRLVVTDAVGLLLDHLADGVGEYVVVDLPADASPSARFDLTVLVSEPTRRAAELYRGHSARASAEGAELGVLGNKISDWGDAARLIEQMGDALLGCVGHSAWIRAAERGAAGPIEGLEPGNAAALAALKSAVDGRRPALETTRARITLSEQCYPRTSASYSASSR